MNTRLALFCKIGYLRCGPYACLARQSERESTLSDDEKHQLKIVTIDYGRKSDGRQIVMGATPLE